MKFYCIILLFFTFSGCSVSPFESANRSTWHQNKLKLVFREDFSYVVARVKKSLNEPQEEAVSQDLTYIESENLKVCVKKLSQYETEVSIKAGILGDKKLTEEAMGRIASSVNSVEYDENGVPIN